MSRHECPVTSVDTTLRITFAVKDSCATLVYMTTSLTCNRCKETKPVAEFNINRRRVSGYDTTRCKACAHKYYEFRKSVIALDTPDTLSCRTCLKDKPPTEFYSLPTSARGYRADCKDCSLMATRERNSEPEQQAALYARNLMRNYGITLDEYNQMLDDQGGVCYICKRDNPGRKNAKYFSVDHCHTTLTNRKLLCQPCNFMLGHAEDSVETLLAAASYLQEHR